MPKGSHLKKLWADPEWRAKTLAKMRSPEFQAKRQKALFSPKGQSANKAKNNIAKMNNADLRRALARARKMNERMMASLQRVHITGNPVDRRRGTEVRAVSTRGVSTLLTDEEHTLLRMACLALGMTNRQFIQEALMFYAIWAVDSAKAFQEPSELVRERIGLRAPIDAEARPCQSNGVTRPLRTAAE